MEISHVRPKTAAVSPDFMNFSMLSLTPAMKGMRNYNGRCIGRPYAATSFWQPSRRVLSCLG